MNEIKLRNTLQEFTLPAYREIPNVGLYLDQVVKYINSFFVDFPEMQITGSMVSNYVKKKLVSSPVRKTYNKDQIASLIFISSAKTVISLEHIRICLKTESIFACAEQSYDTFANSMQDMLHEFYGKKETGVEERNALLNIVTAIAHKMYLERYFEELKACNEPEKKEKIK